MYYAVMSYIFILKYVQCKKVLKYSAHVSVIYNITWKSISKKFPIIAFLTFQKFFEAFYIFPCLPLLLKGFQFPQEF